MKNKFWSFLILGLVLAGSGCYQPITVPKIAEQLGAADQTETVAAQYQGFGKLPEIQISQAQDLNQMTFKATLPSLQPTIAVLRLPATNLKTTEFQNLTQAIGLPAGLIGNQTQNLNYNLTWTNQSGVIWQFFSNDRKISFTDNSAEPAEAVLDNWLGQTRLLDSVDMFLKEHGINERRLKNIQIIPRWSEWLKKLDQLDGCVPADIRQQMINLNNSKDLFYTALPELPDSYTAGCVKAYPARIPVSFEKLIDGWNVVGRDGAPEYGGQIIVNAATGQPESGWIYLPSDPQRSDYPAITSEEMKDLIQQGGLSGPLPGDKTVHKIDFAFVRLPKEQNSLHEFMVPAVIAETTRLVGGYELPYRIVVPLIKK